MASTTVKSWSISKLHDYEKCPRFFQLRHVERIPDPRPSKAADRGTEIHNAAEYFVKGEGPMIKEMYTFATEFQHLRNFIQNGFISFVTNSYPNGDFTLAQQRGQIIIIQIS